MALSKKKFEEKNMNVDDNFSIDYKIYTREDGTKYIEITKVRIVNEKLIEKLILDKQTKESDCLEFDDLEYDILEE